MYTYEEQPKSETSWTARGEFGMYGRHRVQTFDLVARFQRRTNEGWETLVEVTREDPDKRFRLDDVPHPARAFFADHFELTRKIEANEPIGEEWVDPIDEEPFEQRLERIAAESPRQRRQRTSRSS